MKEQFPHQVTWLFAQFAKHHYELYIVGGSVRDYLLHRQYHDFDFTTNATPQEMMHFLQNQPCKIIPTGIKHGTLTILYDQEAMEVTTYRCEQGYEDHRRPTEITFSSRLLDDLARRDFTINAMAYHPDIGIVDPFDGQKDLKAKLIRCVGNSEERFEEDALRMLRALRFSFQLQFSLEPSCAHAIQHKAKTLSYISKERIKEEFDKMLLSDANDILSKLRYYHILPYIIDEMTLIYDIPQESKWHLYDVFKHTDIALNHTKGYTLPEKLAIVFHDIGKAQTKTMDEAGAAHFHGHPRISAAIAEKALKSLTYSNQIIKQVLSLILYHDYYLTPKRNILRRFLAHIHMDYEIAYAILRVQYADDCAKNMTFAQEKLTNIDACVALLKKMEQEEARLQLRDMAVNGTDMITLGLEGKQIKEVLQYLYELILDTPEKNERSYLLEQAKCYKQKK